MKAALAAAITAALLATGGGAALAQSATDQMTGRHSMQGTVTSVSKKGWVHVKTDAGTVIAYFPPADLQGIKKGDMVTLDMAMKDNGPMPKK